MEMIALSLRLLPGFSKLVRSCAAANIVRQQPAVLQDLEVLERRGWRRVGCNCYRLRSGKWQKERLLGRDDARRLHSGRQLPASDDYDIVLVPQGRGSVPKASNYMSQHCRCPFDPWHS